ncbi:CIR protein PIR protein [Plasmodium vinckei vinckei]|uniref:CIR protein PIR protein n=1 Tax=Plasmodium vinckei vinckei TaxID=54757 RepID=A0A449BNV1_PLAVN|nr:CIR protein PIR protein [Plasmodium vinckei vinckei]VEV55114.1 CIR protein PIR protein [Plasmodium vinckei vinckei]
MDKHKLMCEFIIKGDSYFKGKNVDTTKINKEISIKSYCSNDDCKTNEERINALSVYIYMEFKNLLKGDDYNKYDECLLMWISNILFKIHDKSKDKKTQKGYVDPITLKSAYEKYLEKHKVKGDYWVLFDHIKGLKNANLRYMAEFYMLLNRICKTIVDYKNNGAGSNKLYNYSKKCLDQYINLYLNTSGCKSYLHLLKKLKGIYDDFRVSAIEENPSNNNLATNLKKLITLDGLEINGTKGFISYEFPKKKCNSLDKKAASVQLQSSSKEESPLPQEPEKKESAPQSSELQQIPTALPSPPQAQKQDSASTPPSPEQPKDQLSEQKDSDGSGNNRDGTDSDQVEDGTQSTAGDPFNTGPLIFEIVSKGMEQLNNAREFVGKKKEQLTKVTDTINSLYNTSVSNIKNNFYKFPEFFNNFINNLSIDSKQVENPPDSDDKESDSGGGGDGPSQPQKNSKQTSSETSPSSTEQTQEPRESQDSSENHYSDQNGHESEKPVEGPVIKPEDPEFGVKGNGTIGIGDIFIFKEFKKIGIPIIVIIISITLAIMYKFLVFERRKKLKRKKMKKVTNLFGVNKTT